MKVKITEAHEVREAVFERLLTPSERSDYAAQHDVWPCVLKGAAERWLSERGETFRPAKSSALYFLRGHSAEALIGGVQEDEKLVVRGGVACHPDGSFNDLVALGDGIVDEATREALLDWLEDHNDVAVVEIKSTNYSSFNWYRLVKDGTIPLDANEKFPMRNYIDQCANYCVATGSTRAVLIIYFLHGDYADRRSKCPECGNRLGDWVDDFYRECDACGYKSKKADLWAYLLEFDDATLRAVDRDVFKVRPAQFYAALRASDEAGVREAADATPNFYCRSCRVGERIGCENAGKEHD